MHTRESLLHIARVYLTECGARRHDPVNRNFYWRLFAWAQDARRRAAVSGASQLELRL